MGTKSSRYGSPSGGSILITSAPKSDRMVAAAGAAMKLAQSMTRRPVKGPALLPDGPPAAAGASLFSLIIHPRT